MSFRMHRYPNGLEGLAAFCDTCGQQITEHGYIVWNSDDVTDWLVIHQNRCDPGPAGGYGCSMPLDSEIVYLANSAGVDLAAARQHTAILDEIG